MSRTALLPPKPDVLTDPGRTRFRVAQRVAALGEGWVQVDAPPEGEVLWREGRDNVRLTPDGWLVYVDGGRGSYYTSKVRATPELVAVLRGGPR